MFDGKQVHGFGLFQQGRLSILHVWDLVPLTLLTKGRSECLILRVTDNSIDFGFGEQVSSFEIRHQGRFDGDDLNKLTGNSSHTGRGRPFQQVRLEPS